MKFRAILELTVELHGETPESVARRIKDLIAKGFDDNRVTEKHPAEISAITLEVFAKRSKKRTRNYVAAKQQTLF